MVYGRCTKRVSYPVLSSYIEQVLLRKTHRPPADGSGRSYVPRNEQRHVLTLYPPPNKTANDSRIHLEEEEAKGCLLGQARADDESCRQRQTSVHPITCVVHSRLI